MYVHIYDNVRLLVNKLLHPCHQTVLKNVSQQSFETLFRFAWKHKWLNLLC